MWPNYFPPFSGHEKGAQLFGRGLWTVKVNFLVRKFGAMELNYIYVSRKSTPSEKTIFEFDELAD
jgi:hypothetical protein